MHRSITIALVVESTRFVEPVEVGFVCFAPPEVQGPDLEVGEELAVVVLVVVAGIEEPGNVGFGVDQVRMCGCEGAGPCPEGGEGAAVVEDVHVEAVLEVVVAHEAEDVVVDVAEVVDLFFDEREDSKGWSLLTSGSTLQYQS